MPVPLANIYYLLCYAWDQLPARDLIDTGSIAGNRIENLLGKVMKEGVTRLLRQGLDRGYVDFDEESRRFRGKLLMTETMSRALLPNGYVACRAHDLTHDVPHNRVVKAAMRALAGLEGLDPVIREALREHSRRMSQVAEIELSLRAFRNVQLHRNAARYALMVHVAYLVAQSFFPEERSRRQRFHRLDDSEQFMGGLFEKFVRNFLRGEQSDYKVGAEKVTWNLGVVTELDRSWLSELKTDVVLRNRSRRLVIETKYYAQPYQNNWGRRTIISSHLYQLLTYMHHLQSPDSTKPNGMLLYAKVGQDYAMDYEIGGYRVMVRTLDLTQNWEDIHRDLLALVHS